MGIPISNKGLEGIAVRPKDSNRPARVYACQEGTRSDVSALMKVVYFDLPEKGKHSTKTFNVMLNASYLGTYYLPGIQAEAMYDNEYLVRTKGKWVVVEK